MVIDPFTIIAQVVNFIILILLLRRFLYGPIVRTMDARELHITKELDMAERNNKEAAEQAALLHDERQDLENRRGELLSQARTDAEKLRGDLIAEARAEVETRRSRWQESVEREKETFLADLQQRVSRQVYEISRRVLSDLADVELQKHIIDTFISRLRQMDEEHLAEVSAQFTSWQPLSAEELEEAPAENEAVLTSAFEIGEQDRARIEKVVHERLGESVNLSFEEMPDLICGIELKTHGYKAAWSLENYMETLDESLSLAFAAREEAIKERAEQERDLLQQAAREVAEREAAAAGEAAESGNEEPGKEALQSEEPGTASDDASGDKGPAS